MPAITDDSTKPVRIPKETKTVLVPEPMAHSISRKIKLTEEQLAKLQNALDNKLPLMMAIGLRAQMWGVVDQTVSDQPIALKTARTTAESGEGYCDGDEEIMDEDVQPPDEGEEIPEDEGDEEGPEELQALAKTGVKGSTGRGKLIGATIQYYAVAVFRPEFSKE